MGMMMMTVTGPRSWAFFPLSIAPNEIRVKTISLSENISQWRKKFRFQF